MEIVCKINDITPDRDDTNHKSHYNYFFLIKTSIE